MAEAPNLVNGLWFISQLKYIYQRMRGDTYGAEKTWMDFTKFGLGVAQARSLYAFMRGRGQESAEINHLSWQTTCQFWDGVTTFSPIGYIKGTYYVFQEEGLEKADACYAAANKSLMLIGSGVVGGAIGGPVVAATVSVAAGVTADVIQSKITKQPQGVVARLQDIRAAENSAGPEFDMFLNVVGYSSKGLIGARLMRNVHCLSDAGHEHVHHSDPSHVSGQHSEHTADMDGFERSHAGHGDSNAEVEADAGHPATQDAPDVIEHNEPYLTKQELRTEPLDPLNITKHEFIRYEDSEGHSFLSEKMNDGSQNITDVQRGTAIEVKYTQGNAPEIMNRVAKSHLEHSYTFPPHAVPTSFVREAGMAECTRPYDLVDHNCQHVANELYNKVGGEQVHDLPNESLIEIGKTLKTYSLSKPIVEAVEGIGKWMVNKSGH